MNYNRFKSSHPKISFFSSEPFLLCLALSVSILAAVAIQGCVADGDRQEIRSWVSQRNEEAIIIESRPFLRGPYAWTSGKHHRVYCIQTASGNVYWIRKGNWGADDIEQEKDGKFVVIQ